MCGICGLVALRGGFGSSPVHRLKTMADSIAHRGPDDEGFHIEPRIALGFRRLSIIDIAGGHQPMSNETGTVWTVFNGEIYNYRDLRSELEQEGHRFRTQSDTEVVVHGYEQWGPDVLSHLNGMFGLAVWDSPIHRLMLARDRLGIKLVYYTESDGVFGFASEIRALLSAGIARRSVDVDALYLFLRHRYTPSPLTIFDGVRKLAPGTRLFVEEESIRTETWWDYSPPPAEHSPSYHEAIEELSQLYRRAVARHLVSDVPVGILLSGGVDSALLLSLMKEHGGGWPSFTVGYGSSYHNDELALAQQTAAELGSEHVGVKIDRAGFERDLPRVVSSLEEPIASASIVPMYHVCQRARESVKVAFVGQGPDELFGGYSRHLAVRYGQFWRRVPQSLRAGVKRLMSLTSRSETVRRAMFSLDVEPRLARYCEILALADREQMMGLFREGSLAPDIHSLLPALWSHLSTLGESADELGAFQLIELRSTLPDELLMYADKLSMAHGLELRVPYLDYTIVEYVERLPSSYKVRLFHGKRIHRSVCERYLGRDVLARPKRGFAADVVDDWFRGSVSSRMSDYFLSGDSLMYRHLRQSAVERLLLEHRSGRTSHFKLLFSLAVFEEWLRQAGV